MKSDHFWSEVPTLGLGTGNSGAAHKLTPTSNDLPALLTRLWTETALDDFDPW